MGTQFEDNPQQNGGSKPDDDQLFAAADAGDIWGSTPGGDEQPAAKEEKQGGDALFDDNFGDDFGSGDVVFADDKPADDQKVVSPDIPNMDDPMFGGDDPGFPNFGATISEMNGASDVD